MSLEVSLTPQEPCRSGMRDIRYCLDSWNLGNVCVYNISVYSVCVQHIGIFMNMQIHNITYKYVPLNNTHPMLVLFLSVSPSLSLSLLLYLSFSLSLSLALFPLFSLVFVCSVSRSHSCSLSLSVYTLIGRFFARATARLQALCG